MLVWIYNQIININHIDEIFLFDDMIDFDTESGRYYHFKFDSAEEALNIVKRIFDAYGKGEKTIII